MTSVSIHVDMKMHPVERCLLFSSLYPLWSLLTYHLWYEPATLPSKPCLLPTRRIYMFHIILTKNSRYSNLQCQPASHYREHWIFSVRQDLTFALSVVLQPKYGLGRLINGISRSHKMRHKHTSCRTPLSEWQIIAKAVTYTTNTEGKYPRIQRDSNPWPSGCRLRP
jgi:hypothetical protein